MADGLEEAAQAFQRDLSGTPPRSNDRQPENEGRPERLFGDQEMDESEGEGGDSEPLPNERRERQPRREPDEGRNTERQPKQEEGDPDDPEGLYQDEDDEEGEGKRKTDGDDEEEGDDEENQENRSGPVDLNAKVKVKVDGEDVEVTLKEALGGYIRTETLHRRLNGINEERNAVRTERGEINQARELAIDMLTKLKRQLDTLAPQEPNWVDEYKKDPEAAGRAQQAWRDFAKHRQQLDADEERLRTEKQQEDQRAHREWAQDQSRLTLVAIPEWHDQRKFEIDAKRIRKTAKAAGFSDKEVNGVIDHRFLVVMRKAALYDTIKSARPKAVTTTGQSSRRGTGTSRTAPTGMSKAARRLSKTGSLADGAAFFEGILKQER